MISQKELKDLLHYDPDSGEFVWRISSGRAKAGVKAGYVNSRGYVQIGLRNSIYYIHRLAFLYQDGRWPENDVDHVNGIKTDNRWSNLRSVSHSINMRNMAIRSDNKSGAPGVSFLKEGGKWKAYIKTDSKLESLGLFNSFDDALAARKAVEPDHGYHENHGRSG